MNRIAVCLLIYLSAGLGGAQAQSLPPSFYNLTVLPAPAYAGQLLRARSQFDVCARQQDIDASQVAVVDHVVTLTIQMASIPSTAFCLGVPPPPATVEFSIGSLAPGDYTLIQQVISPDQGISYAPLTTSFSVGPAVRAIPAASSEALLLLALLLPLAAWFGIRMRGR